MRSRVPALLAFLLAIAPACGSSTGAGALTREVVAAIDETRDVSRTFRYLDETLDGDQSVSVEGKVQDDLRYSGTVTIDGKKLYQQIVSDDSVAIRLLDLDATKRAVAAARRVDPVTADALATGRWVVDHTVAPPLLAAAGSVEDDEERTADAPTAGQRRANLVGDDPFTDSAQVLNYAERSVRRGFRVERFNREDIDYNPLDDPWRTDSEADLEDRGVRRYDLFLPPLPRPAERGREQVLATIEHFRKMAFYAKGDRVVEIREQIAIGDRREFRRAEAGRSAEFYLQMRDAALGGGLRDEFRERRMSYVVTDIGRVAVKLPRDAEKGILRQVVPELKSLYEFQFIGGGPRIPIGPGGSPLPVTTGRPPARTEAPAPASPGV